MKTTIHGFSLIEILISLFILAIILLGYDAMLMMAARYNRSAYFYTIATWQLFSLNERLRAVGHGHDYAQMVIWQQQNQRLFPSVHERITGKFPLYQIRLQWNHVNYLEEQLYL